MADVRERNKNLEPFIVTMKRARMIFSGRVQGVFFRANCQRKAVDLGLKGWVKNLPDGRVESVAEGPEERIKQLIEWNSNHQPHARVDEVKVEWEPATGECTSFSVAR